MTVRLYDDRLCSLGEGALWHPLRDQLFWFDILAGRLLSRDASGPLAWDLGQMASAAGWVDRETLVIATETGLRRFDIATGAHQLLVAIEPDRRNTRSNDGRADPFGGFWIGTMGKSAEPGQGTIYRYFQGAITPILTGLTIPNAICFSPDGTLAYFADTPTQQIMVQPLDAVGWPRGAAQVFVDLAPHGLYPDGAVTDAAGGLWNAQWGAGRIARYAPDGRFDRAVAVPGLHASCPAFGGIGLATLFVTTARQGMADPDSNQGAVYAADPDATGRAEPRVAL